MRQAALRADWLVGLNNMERSHETCRRVERNCDTANEKARKDEALSQCVGRSKLMSGMCFYGDAGILT